VLCYSYKNKDEEVALKITMEMSKGAYEITKKVYLGQITRNEGKIEINRVTGMNEGSAQAFITIFLAMMNGEEYKRAFNNETNKFLLGSIRQDFGEDYYKNALDAVQKHINYYSTLGKGNLTGLQTIVNQMRY
jgi:5-methylcytosine-specific restriction protein A